MDGDSTANTAGIAVQLKFAHGTTTGLPTKATGTQVFRVSVESNLASYEYFSLSESESETLISKSDASSTSVTGSVT